MTRQGNRLAGTALWALALIVPAAAAADLSVHERPLDVILVMSSPLAEKCGCAAGNEDDIHHPTVLTAMCSAAQACLELDDVQTTLERGRCPSVSGVECENVSSPCEATIQVRVTVHSVCCCGDPNANGANVYATGHGCDFVPLGVAHREVVTIHKHLACETGNSETIFLQASCSSTCSEIDDLAESGNAQVGFYQVFACEECKKP